VGHGLVKNLETKILGTEAPKTFEEYRETLFKLRETITSLRILEMKSTGAFLLLHAKAKGMQKKGSKKEKLPSTMGMDF